MEKVYVVAGHCGEYSDYETWPVAVMADKAKADEYAAMCEKLAAELDEQEKKAYEAGLTPDEPKHPLDPGFHASRWDSDKTTYDVAEVPWKEQG